MSQVNSYQVGFWATGGQLCALINMDAHNKKEVEELAKGVRATLLPLLIAHYKELGLAFQDHLKIIITDYKPTHK